MFQSISYEECLNLSPLEMAQRSEIVLRHQSYLQEQLRSLNSQSLQELIGQILRQPYPAFMNLYGCHEGRAELERRLIEAGFYDPQYGEKVGVSLMPPVAKAGLEQGFLETPGSGMNSHHNFPGGLSVHVAVNLQLALAAQQVFEEGYGYQLNRDLVVAAQLLHDCQKPYVLQWQSDGSIRPQVNLARTGSHHIFGLAQSLYYKLPAAVVVAQACAHNHVASQRDEAVIIGWLKCAAFIAQIDPIEYGLLEASGDTLPLPRLQENGLAHLGDHTWVLTLPATQWLNPIMLDIAQSDYGIKQEDLNSKAFYSLRNYVFSQATTLYLHQLYVQESHEGLRNFVQKLVIKKPAAL